MAAFTLGTASQATGCAKSTILRAIRAGRISASRDELQQWRIDSFRYALTVASWTGALGELNKAGNIGDTRK
jgi:GH24 family phage-related lysozyme (muramidase)